jgi:hypothetical protein
MKLSMLYENGHWETFKRHPGQLGNSGKTRKRYKKQEMSFLTHPEDRKKFVHWGHKKSKDRK